MDLARRVVKIMTNQRGVMVFLKIPEPITGFCTVVKRESYSIAAMTADELVTVVRAFLMVNLTTQDGITVYRRGGRMTLAHLIYHETQSAAEVSARVNNASHIIDLSTKTSIQVGDYEPDVPGDGDV